MPERPTPDSLTLTPYERRLCVACVLVWVGGLLIAGFAPELNHYLRWEIFQWARDQWRFLLSAELPEISIGNSLNFLALGTLSGAVLLAPQYLAHLIARGRWLSLGALWLWTMLHAMLTIVLALTVLALVSQFWWKGYLSAADRGWVALWLLLLAVSLGLFFSSLRAWRWRRWKENAGTV